MPKFVKRVKSWGTPAWDDEEIRFLRDNSTEMSTIELAIHFGADIKNPITFKKAIDKVKSICSKRGFTYFSEIPLSWKKKGYIIGLHGYAMYPYRGSYRQSATVTNLMLTGA